MIFYFLTLVLSFFSRKIFLDCLGADFLGLTGSLGSLLGFLNLAELGIGTVVGYTLYKPIYDQDQQKINEIISYYEQVGYIISTNPVDLLKIIEKCRSQFLSNSPS